MLTQIVRPMVRTQSRLLANSQATRSTLVRTIAQSLSFLGVQAIYEDRALTVLLEAMRGIPARESLKVLRSGLLMGRSTF